MQQSPFQFTSEELTFEVKLGNSECEVNQLLASDAQNACYEEMNRLWFEKFNLLQEKGYDVEEADSLALHSASMAYKLCDALSLVYLD